VIAVGLATTGLLVGMVDLLVVSEPVPVLLFLKLSPDIALRETGSGFIALCPSLLLVESELPDVTIGEA
jgi:hypothetical protein